MTNFDDKILCHCFHVPETEVREAVESEGLRRVSEVTACTRAGGGCFSCWPEIEAILGGTSGEMAGGGGDSENIERFRKLVENLLEAEIVPLLSLNRIRVTLLDVEENRILVQFEGPWEGTPPISFEVIRQYFGEKVSVIAGHRIELWEGSLGHDEETGLPTL